MMNPIIQSLFDRKSCRIFKDKEISQEERKLILEACETC
jgi:nitroreductase